MRLSIKLILGSVLALIFGLLVAWPILVQNLALTTTVEIEVDVVYAYFNIPEFSDNITGLWRESYKTPIISHFIVLNITNHSNETADITELDASAAERVDLTPSGGVSITNSIAYDFRDVTRYYPGWAQYWMPGQSRLVGFSGMREVSSAGYDALLSGSIYLFGRARARPYGGSYSTGQTSKQVQLQVFGREFLYNTLLSENQILHFTNEIDVYVWT